ncbi:class I SAM-dependent methyltransferase, partial [Patescibacteria group bacterium]|nr:class I SAM-dependent methyltransferase [Patescibacteria group bacterium]
EFDFSQAKVLDFGCGTGSNSWIFPVENYLGADVDRERIKFAKKIYPSYQFAVINNNTIPANDKSFDFICIFATIHHIPDSSFKEYLKQFKRILKDQGKVIVIEPVLLEKHKLVNLVMNNFDAGKFIRSEQEYLNIFNLDFSVTIHNKFRKFLLYNEIFFSAEKNR